MTAQFETIHAQLGSDFFDPVDAADFPETIIRFKNDQWAKNVGLDHLSKEQWIAHFGRFQPFDGSLKQPLALRYHGHQFQNYNPQLGDGRGFLFAQIRELGTNRLLDLATKGSGQTPWSRQGDGRLTLKGGVREILATEMLEALGVNTSKTFSIIETGEQLHRGDEPSPTRSAVMVRLSHSHIRIGSFQRQAALKKPDNVLRLMDHTIKHYMPHIWHDDTQQRITAFLAQVTENVAKTGAAWTAAGFVHGVLNTDNINVTGESFDYGPWRFLPYYDPGFTAAYFDENGLYSFGRQPEVLLWNLARLAECFVGLAQAEQLQQSLAGYWAHFQSALTERFCNRLGLTLLDNSSLTHGPELVRVLIEFWSKTKAPFEQVMFDLRGGALKERLKASPIAETYLDESFKAVHSHLAACFKSRSDACAHPYFQQVSPRQMLIDDVEAIWDPIDIDDDWEPLQEVLEQIKLMKLAYHC